MGLRPPLVDLSHDSWGEFTIGGRRPTVGGPSGAGPPPGLSRYRAVVSTQGALLWMENILPVKMLGGLRPPRTPHDGPPAPIG